VSIRPPCRTAQYQTREELKTVLQNQVIAIANKEEVFSIAERIINEHRPAFEALAKFDSNSPLV
jgi:hypothetical protein